MFSQSSLAFVALSLLLASESALARIRWLERDGRSVKLYPRRFGLEHPAVIDKLSSACPGQFCGTLAGQAITPLLAAQGECTQQDMADTIIDTAQQFDAATKANMIALAIEYRQAEKNTPPDFTTNPPTNRNSVFCQKAPKHSELNGLVQAQDPANDPNIFFDPATGKSVTRGSQPNTFPFGTAGSASSNSSSAVTSPATAAATTTAQVLADDTATAPSDPCIVTVTVTSGASATSAVAAVASSISAPVASTTASSAIGNFGSCSVPQIEFAVGFDNRKETSFQPVDKTSYDHGSAQAIGIISQFICDTLTNKCGADQTAKDTCTKAKAAADTQAAKTGAQADAFNAVFGITTNFAAVAVVDDQGRVVSGGSTGATSQADAATGVASSTAAAASTTAASSGIGNFGSCSVPQIEFGVGFDNRKETSFQPVDKSSYNHGSAQAIDIISQFVCDTLTNKCGADQTAKDACAKAKAAADTKAAKTGAQADAFNAVFGITTNFAAVAVVDDQGRVVSGGTSPQSATATPVASSTATTATTTSSGIGDFGKCSVPQIEFGTGFDARKETSFQPVDKVSYNHDSAQNGDIITQFICDTLVNTCGADQTARSTCATAKAAFDTKTAKTGAQADAFNAVFGIKTNFAAVPAVDNQGNTIAGSTSGSLAAASAPAASNPTPSKAAVTTSASAAVATGAAGANLQTFSGALGGISAPTVTNVGNQFQVEGNAAFNSLSSALQRSCDVQHNKCADAANASGNKGTLTVSACGDQQTACSASHQ